MIEVKGIGKSFDGRAVLRDVSFSLPAGRVTALTGRSGTGKTTLTNILLGLMAPDEGRIEGLAGRKAAAVFQEDRLIEQATGRENVRLVLPKGASGDRYLRLVGLDPGDGKRVSLYSGGMRRRVAIARALAVQPQFLILDEPFKGLDGETRQSVAQAILKEARAAAILFISHEPEELRLMEADSVYELAGIAE